jgi:hypothetical protein
MPPGTLVEMPEAEPAQLRAGLRRARDGSRLALHRWWWWATGRHPTAIAAVLLCSRSSV